MSNDRDLERHSDASITFRQVASLDGLTNELHEDHQDDGTASSSEDHAVVGWKDRVRYYQWTFFTLNMATGGVANVIFTCPLQFHGLYTIGVIFVIINLLIFIINCIAISLRFYHWPGSFRRSFLHPTESLFAPAPIISVSIIFINITQYGIQAEKTGPWLITAMTICFWLNIVVAVTASITMYLIIWSSQTHTIQQMTPVWIFPAYPLLLVGPFAGNLALEQSGDRALEIIVGGVIVQGIGFMVSFMIYAAYLSRLMTQKLPAESSRPGMFISVGPSGFTIFALIKMAAAMPATIGPYFMGNGPLTAQITQILANWVGIWLWGLALWFFFVSVAAHYTCVSQGRMHFAMTWNSFVFPNTGLAIATFAVAEALDNNKAIEIIGAVILVALVVMWMFNIFMMIRAYYLKQILWPQEGDRDAQPRGQQSRNKVKNTKIRNGKANIKDGTGPGERASIKSAPAA